MITKFSNKYLIILSALFALICSNSVNAQVYPTQGDQLIKFLSVSGLRQWFSNLGSEIEYGRRGRSGFESVDQLDGLAYPSEYDNNKGVMVSKALWIGTTNFTDPVSARTYPYKVVCSGPRAVYAGTEIFPQEFTLIAKSDHPGVFVDNAPASFRDEDDEPDIIDENLPADRVLVNTFHTSMGITVTKKVYVYSQQYHDNYYIYEYTFKNTGIINNSGEKVLNKTLTDVIFWMQWRLGFAGESYLPTSAWAPTGSTWGRNALNDAIGQDAAHPGDFRAVWAYYGPHSGTAFGGAEGDFGLPGPNQNNVRILAGTQFAGAVVLHADKSVTDRSDDRSQPSTTQYVGTDNSINVVDQYNDILMGQKYTDFMTAGHPALTHADEVGKNPTVGWPTGFVNTWGSDAGGYASAMGFGPYDIPSGDSIRIVIAEAVASISREKNREVARNWFENNSSAFILPDGSTTSDRNVYKNSWVFSGRDTLFQSFRRAIDVYNNNYVIPQPPPAPDQFVVASGGNKIVLSWADNATNSDHFNGYQLYRAEGRTDTIFQLIKEWDKDNAPSSFEDLEPQRGLNYYYYIVSKDDGIPNNIHPGTALTSSRYYTMTSVAANLKRPAGLVETTPTSALYNGDGVTTDFILPVSVLDSTGSPYRGVTVYINGVLQVPATFQLLADTLRFYQAPSGSIEAKIITPTGQQITKLSEIRIVPNPFNIKARNIQFGTESDVLDRLAFFGLPPECKIRIYTETGDLIETIDHTNGSGDEYWHSLTSSRQIVVSGLYIAHFEVTNDAFDENGVQTYRKGDTIYKKFIIIR